jgi:hypothetical protein
MHFFLAALLGLVVFSLTAIISTASLKLMGWIGVSPKRTVFVMRGMVISSLLLGIAAAWLSHVGLDYYYAWYTKPLGPPLQLMIQGLSG